jgi:hypothetical protein
VCLLTIIDTMSATVSGSRLTSESYNSLPRGHMWEVGVTPEVLSPAMSVSTPTDEGESTEVPVVVVSC